jgi:hypothetical protein
MHHSHTYVFQSIFIAAWFIIAKKLETTQIRIDKYTVVFLNSRILFSNECEWITATTNLDAPHNQCYTKKYRMLHDCIYVSVIKRQPNLQ